jgi:coenzyme F420-0:L-glutamate ligase/coenzyme F420-1:gamma-L-glutamate ligase
MIMDEGHKIIAVLPMDGAIERYVLNNSTDADMSQNLCENEKCLFFTKGPSGRIHTCDAGIDGSNHPEGIVSLFPQDPDGEALKIRNEIKKISGRNVAVVVADTELTLYGTIDAAVGSAGINPCSLMFGKKDKFGKPKLGGFDLVGQEITSASALLFGQTDAGIPVTIIRGYQYDFDEKRNIGNTMHFAGDKKDVFEIVRRTMELTSYAVDGFKKKILLRIGAVFVR